MESLRKYQCFKAILLIVAYLSLCIVGNDINDNQEEHKTQDHHNYTISSGSGSCVEAQRPSDPMLTKAICHPYSAGAQKPHENGSKPEVCRAIIGDDLLFATPAEQEWRENLFVTYTIRFRGRVGQIPRMPETPRQLLTKFCWRLIVHMYCRFLLPKCDMTSSRPRAQPICREACREFKNHCQREWTRVQRKHKTVTWKVQRLAAGMEGSSLLMWCKDLPRRKGGNIPECYYPEMLKEKTIDSPPITETCFYGDGQSYRGNASVTQSGYTCQSWSSQCPHRHHRTPDNFPELKDAGNACRNPGGQAPHGPWCYTTNRKVRWEYCRVDKCVAREE